MISDRAIFLDRDGVVNEDYGYVSDISDFVFKPKFLVGCLELQSLGYILFIVTNQSGIGRGYFSKSQYNKLTQSYQERAAKAGVVIEDIMYCPHTPDDNCVCRKPKSFMIDSICEKYSINRQKSGMVGDKGSDIESSINANLKYNFLQQGNGTFETVSSTVVAVKNLVEVAH